MVSAEYCIAVPEADSPNRKAIIATALMASGLPHVIGYDWYESAFDRVPVLVVQVDDSIDFSVELRVIIRERIYEIVRFVRGAAS